MFEGSAAAPLELRTIMFEGSSAPLELPSRNDVHSRLAQRSVGAGAPNDKLGAAPNDDWDRHPLSHARRT
jgi:hypothetical protein